MSHHIDTLPHKKPCGCPEPTGSRAELDALIAEYKTLIHQVETKRDEITAAVLALDGVATEAKATQNKNEILAAIRDIDTYAELTEQEMDGIFEEEDSNE